MVQVDGINIEPISVDEFRFGPGETCDVIVEPKDDVYTVFSQTMDRTGYALGTLAVKSGLRAPVPAIDKLEWLSMEDMMGDMSNMAGMDHGAMNMGGMSMDKMDMSGMSSMEGDSMAQMPNMAGMDHSLSLIHI